MPSVCINQKFKQLYAPYFTVTVQVFSKTTPGYTGYFSLSVLRFGFSLQEHTFNNDNISHGGFDTQRQVQQMLPICKTAGLHLKEQNILKR